MKSKFLPGQAVRYTPPVIEGVVNDVKFDADFNVQVLVESPDADGGVKHFWLQADDPHLAAVEQAPADDQPKE